MPRHGWSEQRPADWWDGTVHSIRAVLAQVPDAAARVAAICTCGQMHGAVLVDADGRLTRETAPLWNDKRTVPQVEAFAATGAAPEALALTANAPVARVAGLQARSGSWRTTRKRLSARRIS